MTIIKNQHKKISNSKYNKNKNKKYVEKNSLNKININIHIAKCVKKVLNKNKNKINTSIILLDGEKMCSTKSCMKYLSGSQITVVEHNRETYNKIKFNNLISGINLHYGEINEYMKNTNQKNSFAFFDFMDSKLKKYHIECFESFIKNAPKFSIMSVTFANRKCGTVDDHIKEIKNHIVILAKKYKRILKFGWHYVYKRSTSENDNRGCLMIYIDAYIGPWKNIHEEWVPHICYKSKSKNIPNMVWTRWYGFPKEADWTLETIEKMKEYSCVKWQ